MKKDGWTWERVLLLITVFGWGVSVGHFKSNYVPKSDYEADMEKLKAENVALKEQLIRENHEQDKKIWRNTSFFDDLIDYSTPE